MTRQTSLAFKIVTAIPENLSEGVLYVSMEYGTVVHKCCCGCGREVVTPITPTDWKITTTARQFHFFHQLEIGVLIASLIIGLWKTTSCGCKNGRPIKSLPEEPRTKEQNWGNFRSPKHTHPVQKQRQPGSGAQDFGLGCQNFGLKPITNRVIVPDSRKETGIDLCEESGERDDD